MTDKQQRARKLMISVYGAVPDGTMHDLETEVLLQGAGPAIELLAAALPDEQPAQGEMRDRVAEAVHVGRFRHRNLATPFAKEDQSGQEYCYRIADQVLRLLASPAGPAVELEQEYRMRLAAAIEATKDQATRHYIDKILKGDDCFVRVSEALAAVRAILANRMSAERERCAQEAEAQSDVFLSPEYAIGQPHSSLSERIVCAACARAIRALPLTTESQNG